jgi:hypothetical protein
MPPRLKRRPCPGGVSESQSKAKRTLFSKSRFSAQSPEPTLSLFDLLQSGGARCFVVSGGARFPDFERDPVAIFQFLPHCAPDLMFITQLLKQVGLGYTAVILFATDNDAKRFARNGWPERIRRALAYSDAELKGLRQ